MLFGSVSIANSFSRGPLRLAQRTLQKHETRLDRLYEQQKNAPDCALRLDEYVVRWKRWCLGACRPIHDRTFHAKRKPRQGLEKGPERGQPGLPNEARRVCSEPLCADNWSWRQPRDHRTREQEKSPAG
jgi:hypothetical protein